MRYRFLRFPGGKTKSVTYSYDDGCRQDIKVAEILRRYGIRGTFNINSGLFGKKAKYYKIITRIRNFFTIFAPNKKAKQTSRLVKAG